MRIISKRSDYYDSLQEHDDILYVRDDKTAILSNGDVEFLDKLLREMSFPQQVEGVEMGRALILFCGTVYPVYFFHKKSFDMKGVKIYCCQYPSQVTSIIKDKFNVDLKTYKRYRFSFFSGFDFTDRSANDYINHINTLTHRITEFFLKTRSPIVTVHHQEGYRYKERLVLTDKPLSEFGFQSIIPPFEAYQRIKHYLSNDLVYEPLNDFKMSDDLKRDSKGFDKNSFRKMKEKK